MNTMKNYEEIKELLISKSSATYIDTMNLTAFDLEEALAKSSLRVTKRERDESVEKRLNPPSFVVIFYSYINEYQRVPSQEEYIKYYYEINRKWIHEKINGSKNQAFIGRLSRAYPSLFRDIHFYHLLKESKKFEKVIYNMKYDLSGQVDIFVQNKNRRWFGLQLRVNTKNSQAFYEIKPKREKMGFTEEVLMIDMPLNLGTARTIATYGDDLKIYGYKEIKRLTEINQEK